MSGNAWASVIVLTTFLALVVRPLMARQMPKRRWLWMIGLWVAVIIGLAVLFSWFPLQMA
ncbi:MAG: hypothetical protein RIQ99_1928 [Pseudomonadota bacterium]|jgi:multisubunit Na+/H+ antiporter MnhB subunit